jgi:hypothetical protein
MKYEVINRVNCVNLNMITEDGSKQVMSLSLTDKQAVEIGGALISRYETLSNPEVMVILHDLINFDNTEN